MGAPRDRLVLPARRVPQAALVRPEPRAQVSLGRQAQRDRAALPDPRESESPAQQVRGLPVRPAQLAARVPLGLLEWASLEQPGRLVPRVQRPLCRVPRVRRAVLAPRVRERLEPQALLVQAVARPARLEQRVLPGSPAPRGLRVQLAPGFRASRVPPEVREQRDRQDLPGRRGSLGRAVRLAPIPRSPDPQVRPGARVPRGPQAGRVSLDLLG